MKACATTAMNFHAKGCLCLGLAIMACNTTWAAEASGNAGSSIGGVGVETTPNNAGSFAPYAGIDAAQSNYFTYAGLAWAPDRDMTDSGVVLNVFGGHGQFKYPGANPAADYLKGSVSVVDALIGYQWLAERYRLIGFVGVESTDVTLPPPDSASDNAGKETGAKVVLGFETNNSLRPYLDVSASYADAFDSHSIRLRPGYRVGPYIFGGEFLFQGNRSGDFHRVGLFSHYEQPAGRWGQFSVTASGGWGYVDNGNNNNFIGGNRNGPYATLTLALFF